MSWETALRNILLADSAVMNLVGNRIYPLVLPENAALPAIAYAVVNESRAHAMLEPVPLREVTLAVQCYAKTYSQARALADAVTAALDGYRGALGDGYAGIVVDRGITQYHADVDEYQWTVMCAVSYLEG